MDLSFEWSEPLDWQAVYNLSEARSPGLYLWTLEHEGTLVPHYLGETGKPIADRLKEHERMYSSGEFGLRNWDSYFRGRDELLKPSYYRKYSPEEKKRFRDRKEEWRPIVNAEISRQKILVLPTPEWAGVSFRSERMRLEQALGEHLAREFPPELPNLLALNGPIPEYTRRPRADWLRAALRGGKRVHGMPEFLEF
jgi:hypothetical protein